MSHDSRMTLRDSSSKSRKGRKWFAVAGVGLAIYVYKEYRRKHTEIPKKGDIWLDIDLSQPVGPACSRVTPSLEGILYGTGSSISFRDMVDALDAAAKDDRVRGVIGRFNFAEWDELNLACTQEVRNAILKFKGATAHRRNGNKPKITLAVADTFGEFDSALGEYYLASAFDSIAIQGTGEVGLTGLALQHLSFGKLLKDMGIDVTVLTREEYKGAMSALSPEGYTDANREADGSLLRSILEGMLEEIAKSRNLGHKDKLMDIINSCPVSSAKALEMRLVDGIVYPHEALRMAYHCFEEGYPTSAFRSIYQTQDIDSERESDPESKDSNKREVVPLGKWRSSSDAITVVPMKSYVKDMRQQQAKKRAVSNVRSGMGKKVMPRGKTEQKVIAVIDVQGPIVRHGPSRSTACSSNLCETIRKATEDAQVGAIVLRVDSPGGSAVASDSIAESIRDARRSGKPVVCSMGNVAASGGYMIAAACDQIVAQPSTVTGSIGVIFSKFSIERVLQMYGVDLSTIEFGENSTALSILKDFTPKQRDKVDGIIDELYSYFLDIVARGRHMTKEQVRAVAKGRVWTGSQAYEHGLVDVLGGLNDAIDISREAAQLPPETASMVYPEPMTLNQFVEDMAEKSDSWDASSDMHLAVSILGLIFGPEITRSLINFATMTGWLNHRLGSELKKVNRNRTSIEARADDDYDL